MFSMLPYYTNNGLRTHANRDAYLTPFGEDFFRAFFGETPSVSLKVDVEDEGDKYLLETDLPGVNRDDVHISVDDGVLTIAVERNDEKKDEDKQRNYICRERHSSSVRRSFTLDGIDEDGITAEYTDGVLHLTLPKKAPQPEQGARRIEIK